MKKVFALVLVAAIIIASVMANGAQEAASSGAEFKPSKSISWYCSSKPGSAADRFTRKVQGVIDETGALDKATIVVENVTDGSGAVNWKRMQSLSQSDADHTLLTLNLGDVTTMLDNTQFRVKDFKVVATMAQDKKFLYVSKSAPFNDFDGFVEYLKNNDVILGGGKADDNVMFNFLKQKVDKNDHLSYLQTGDTAGTLQAVLGNQVYLGIGKLGTLKDYLASGELKAIVTEGTSRMSGVLSEVPTFAEKGYEGMDFIQTRCVVAAKNISDSAYKYYCDAFKKVATSQEFLDAYVNVYQASALDLVGADAQAYLEAAEKNVIDAGISGKQ